MGRTKRAEAKEKKEIPFKECSRTNCSNKCDFYDSVNGISFCSGCRIMFFCSNEALKIINAQEVEGTIEIISKVFEAMKNHAETHKIDLLYKGFSNELHAYEEKLLNISNKFKNTTESDSKVQYACINRDAIELKKELDQSNLMNNFLKHRFQIDLIQSFRNSSENPVENKINYNEQLIKAKKGIEKNCKIEYSAELEKEKEIIDRKYRSELDKLKNQVKEYTIIIENKNEEIKTNTSKIIELEKENEKLKEVTQLYLKYQLDEYHLKTGTTKPDRIENTDFVLTLWNDSHNEILASMKLLKLPDINRVFFEYIPETNVDLLHFLKYSAPNKTKIFAFGSMFSRLYKIDYYLDGLDTAFKGVTGEVFTFCWSHSKLSLERVIKASSNASRIIISCSKLDCDNNFDFSGPHYSTTYLSFLMCGNYHGNNWSSNPEKLERIIKAISKCSMKDSLQTLNVSYCGVTIQKVEEMLRTHGLSNVNVIDNIDEPSSD